MNIGAIKIGENRAINGLKNDAITVKVKTKITHKDLVFLYFKKRLLIPTEIELVLPI